MHRSPDAHTRIALDSLRRIVRALRLSSGEVERSLGISVAQLFVLQQLRDGKPRSIGELATATLTDRSSVSVVVTKLVEKRLAVRKASRDDARRAELTLLPAGQRLLRRAPEAAQARLVSAIGKLSTSRRLQLATSLSQVAKAMGAAETSLFFESESGRG